MSVNKVILIGRLGADPEIKQLNSGSSVTNFRMATSETWTDKNSGKKEEKTEWHSVVVWGRQAESCAEYLSKGRHAYVEGKLQTRSFEDRNGNKVYKTEVNATIVQFLGGGNNAPKKTEEKGDQGTKSLGDHLNQDFNLQTDAQFTADDIPF